MNNRLTIIAEEDNAEDYQYLIDDYRSRDYAFEGTKHQIELVYLFHDQTISRYYKHHFQFEAHVSENYLSFY
jgi:hypothetical protein